MNEHIANHLVEIKVSSDRAFGFVFCAVFALLAFYPIFFGGVIRLGFLIASGVFLLTALLIPSVLAPANRLWMKFGDFLHGIVSPLALGVVFFLTVLPIGLLMRVFGKDPLRLKIDKDAKSYWISREPPGPSAESLNNQF
jgi:hypothetical protein